MVPNGFGVFQKFYKAETDPLQTNEIRIFCNINQHVLFKIAYPQAGHHVSTCMLFSMVIQ